MALDLAVFLADRVRYVTTLWAKDLRAHDAEGLTRPPAPGARSAADIAWETVLVNRRGAMRVRGEEPFEMVGFPPCPPDKATANALIAELAASAEELLTAAGDGTRIVQYPGGSETSFEYVMDLVAHMMYHLGQINLIQTMAGDHVVHWNS